MSVTLERVKSIKTRFVQYYHKGICNNTCLVCISNLYRLFDKNGNYFEPIGIDNHPYCDCDYKDVKELPVGRISSMGFNSPDVWLKAYDALPDYYISKKIAIEEYGWNSKRNTMAGKAPGKMIGGDVYNNDDKKLPVAAGRVWYECDVDYESGRRNGKRLFYSNDGLMFYSPDHGVSEFYFIY